MSISENLEKNDLCLRCESKNEKSSLRIQPVFDEKTVCGLTSEEVLSFIEKEDIVTVIMENPFDECSDTEDVFRDLVSDEGFENDNELQDALISRTTVKHTFFIQNAKESR